MPPMPPVDRRLGVPIGAALVVSSMLGTGIYSTTGFLIRDLGSPMLILAAWLIGGAVAMAGALTYGRLATALPVNGGEYVILSRLYHPSVGFVAGWVSVLAGFVAPVAAAASVFGSYFARLVGGWPTALPALIAMASVTALHLRGVAFGSRLQIALTAFQLILMTAFIVAGLTWGEPSGVFAASIGKGGSLCSPAFAHALVYVSYSYSGYNAAIYVAGEIKHPERSLTRALVIATAIVTLLYVIINVVYLATAPLEELSGVVDIGATAVEHLLGRAAGMVMAILIGVGLLGFISAMTFAGPRVLLAMGHDDPHLAAYCAQNPNNARRWGTLLQSGVASVLVVTASYEALLTYVGLMLSLSTLLAIVGVFRLGRIASNLAPPIGIACCALLAAVFLVWVIVATASTSPGAAATALLTLVGAAGLRRWATRTR